MTKDNPLPPLRRIKYNASHLRTRLVLNHPIHTKAEVYRAKIPKFLRSSYDQGGEVPFFSVWRAILLEYIATGLFVFYACGSVVVATVISLQSAATPLSAAISQGFAIATFVYAISHTSGGHINPAVTLALSISGHMGIFRGLFYILAQLVGGITGAALLSAILPGEFDSTLGSTVPATQISLFQALLCEFIITFTLLFTIFGTAINKAGSASGTHSLAPLPIGFAVLIGVSIAFSITGGSMNPARSFGPAVVSGTWTNHWVYWIGPMGAALAVGLLERYILLAVPAPLQPDIVEVLRDEAILNAEADAEANEQADATSRGEPSLVVDGEQAINNNDNGTQEDVVVPLPASSRKKSLTKTANAPAASFIDSQYPGGSARKFSLMPSRIMREPEIIITSPAPEDDGISSTNNNNFLKPKPLFRGLNASGDLRKRRSAPSSPNLNRSAGLRSSASINRSNGSNDVVLVGPSPAAVANAIANQEMLTGTGMPGDAGI